MIRNATLITIVCALTASPALAAERAKDPGKPAAEAPKPAVAAPKPAAEAAKRVPEAPTPAPLKATVVSVAGDAQRRSSADAAGTWQAIKPGDVLDELTIIRTGLGAKVELNLSDRGHMTVSSATKIGIAQLRQSGEVVTARLGLKYGAVRAHVDSTRGPNDFQVATPVATLSVRGSGGGLAFSADLGLLLCCTDGWLQLSLPGKKRRVYPAECTNDQLQQSIALTRARGDTQPGDPNGGTTATEAASLIANGGGRGIFTFSGTGGGLPTGGISQSRQDHYYDNLERYPPDHPGFTPPTAN
jgi:hypothetical protein